MEFMPMRTLSREPQVVMSKLQRDGELIITNNGHPTILMIDLVGQDLVEAVNDIRQIRSERKKTAMSRSQQQLEAINQFLDTIRAIDDESLTDEDFAALEKNRFHFDRDTGL